MGGRGIPLALIPLEPGLKAPSRLAVVDDVGVEAMFSFKTWLAVPILALILLVGSPAKAYDGFGGLYSVGDYNLLNFGSSLYDLGGYYGTYSPGLGYGGGYGGYGGGYDLGYGGFGSYLGYGDSGYGGSCGSFMSTCGGGYDYAGLYGSEWGITGYNIDISLYPLGNYDSCGSACGGYNPYMYGMDVGCGVGYCGSGSYYPYSGSDYSSYASPYYDPCGYCSSYPNDYYSSYPMPQYPPSYYDIPRDPWTPTYPPTMPPYAACDNITIMCPSGPITRQPVPLPRNRYDIPRDGGTPPGFPPVNYPYPPVTHNPTYPPTYYPPVTNNPPVYYPPTTGQPPTTYPPPTYPPSNPPVFNPPTYPPVNPPPTANNPPGNPPPDQSGITTTPIGPRRNDIPRS